jgi:hypothetical protein
VPETITTLEQSSTNPLALKVKTALLRAIADDGALPHEVLGMRGMSGRKYRTFINNLIGSIDDARYLEIGVWKGSTLCSAVYGNKVRALAMDNWSQFGAPTAEFFNNLAKFETAEARVRFLETDFRTVDYTTIGHFNVYLFDGPHRREDQHDGIVGAQPALDKHHVLIVDDWNWSKVRKGTIEGVKHAGLMIDHLVEIRTTQDNQHAPIEGENSDWHNGYFIAAVTKPS